MRAGQWKLLGPALSWGSAHTTSELWAQQGGPRHTDKETRAPRTSRPSGTAGLSPKEEPWLSPAQGLGELGGCYPFHTLGSPQPFPHGTVGKPGTSEQGGPAGVGSVGGEAVWTELLRAAGSSALLFLAGLEHRFQAIRA